MHKNAVKIFKLYTILLLFLTSSCTFTSKPTDDTMGSLSATPGALPVPTATITPDITQTPSETPLPSATVPPSETPAPTATENPYPWTDEIPVMYGICFEAALDARDQVFVLRNAEEHIRFYGLADNSGLCSRPVIRNPFEFNNGERVLAGLWSYGTGCDARHDVVEYAIEDNVLKIILQFVTEGDCNYELVRPYWIGVEGVDNVEITVLGADEQP